MSDDRPHYEQHLPKLAAPNPVPQPEPAAKPVPPEKEQTIAAILATVTEYERVLMAVRSGLQGELTLTENIKAQVAAGIQVPEYALMELTTKSLAGVRMRASMYGVSLVFTEMILKLYDSKL